ncbi:hypothetical protein [Celerinatantimonas diazotrophica]|uniref:Hpt domain-containing protein n=1 Tax=Celerinatantimonas diazotrophica TaxID=412034 RepID=A0A4V2PNA3_9GAMM|nr:hypothetical protein [Celerinatantimonas diazotrophica]TCK46318.1 hypothetical protein EV690_3594 [Celerinatantimonas diazotrophica]CAG9295308.1 hypothetical protein CEDIAZO_00420 [Celerinatantimonas diazotrophica]
MIDWQKLTILYGHPQKLAFWLDEIVQHSDQELALLQKARSQGELKTQVSAIFSGIASLVNFSPLASACQKLADAEQLDPIILDELTTEYQRLLILIQQYQSDHQS